MADQGPIDSFMGEFHFLSNFYPSPARLDGLLYRTVEHAYQAAKTEDMTVRRKIRQSGSASQAKRLGRQLLLRENWEKIKLGVMERLVREKFTIHADLKRKLLQTGDRPLTEGNDWDDTFWGVCRGQGQNHLGRILMRVREELRPADAEERQGLGQG